MKDLELEAAALAGIAESQARVKALAVHLIVQGRAHQALAGQSRACRATASAKLFVPEWSPGALPDLFAVLPEAPPGSASASSFPELGSVLVVASDRQAPALVAALTVVFVPAQRSFRRVQYKLEPPA